MHLTIPPFERSSLSIVSQQEAIDGFPDLARRGKAAAAQGLAGEDAKPDFDLVEPAGARAEDGRERGQHSVDRDIRQVVALASVLLWSGAIQGQQIAPAEAAAWVARAREAAEIRTDQNGPFRLRAQVRVWDEEGAEAEGNYQEIWHSSEQWRQDITFQGFHQVFVRNKDQAWRQGNMDYRPYRVFQFAQTLRFPYYLRLRPGERAEKIDEAEAAGVRMKCVALQTTIVPDLQSIARFDRRFCFEIRGGTLVRQEYSNAVWEYADYTTLGSKVFPRVLRYTENGRRVMEVVVEELQPETDTDATVFAPTSQAVVQDWCDSPDPPRILLQPRPRYPKEARRAGIGGEVRVYAVVGKDGKAHNPAVVQSPGPDFDRAILKALPGWRFRPAMCRGKPTDAVTFVELEFKVY